MDALEWIERNVPAGVRLVARALSESSAEWERVRPSDSKTAGTDDGRR